MALLEAKRLRITETVISEVIKKPTYVDITLAGEIRSFGHLNKDLELCVVSRKENDIMVIITFFPCKKGRYGKKESGSKN